MNNYYKKSVLLVSASGLERGGVQMFYFNWIKYSSDKYDFTWYFPVKIKKQDLHYAEEFKALGVNLISGGCEHNRCKRKMFIKTYKDISIILKKQRFDIMQVSTGAVLLTASAISAAKKAGVAKRIAYSANWTNETKKIKKCIRSLFKGYIIRNATDYTGCSKRAVEYMFGKRSDKALVINPCADCREFIFSTKARDEIRRKYKLQDNYVIGNMANFVIYKNHEFLINVFYEIVKIDSNARLMLVGEGPLRKEIEMQSEEYGIGNKVIFCGSTDRPQDYLCAMDVFVFPCVAEGVGQAAVHAQNSGLRTICSDAVPKETKITDLIEYLPLSDSPKKWALKILEYNNGYKRKDMYRAIKDADFDVTSIPKYVDSLYGK